MTVLPVTNDAMVPVSVPGRLVSVVEPVSESDDDATVAVRLCGLSVPVQLWWTGVTVYRHVPGAMAASVHVSVVTSPAQPAPIAAGVPVVAS